MKDQVWMYRHDEIQTGRPFGIDVDSADWLWEGCGHNRLTGHNLRTAETVQIPVPEMAGRSVVQVIAWQEKLVLTLGDAPYYLVYDPVRRACERREIPGDRPIVWYGVKAPCGKVLLFERSESRVLVLDGPLAEPRVVVCPFDGQLAGGWCVDGIVYSPMCEPSRIIRFDPRAEQFVDERPGPYPDAALAGYLEHRGVLYVWDTAKGRIFPMEPGRGGWEEGIPTSDHGQIYGFMGGGFGFKGRAYICLSTYMHPSRLDPKTGRIVIPDGPLTVDGMPPRFLDRFLIFDPDAMAFDYLAAPEQPDGVSLLCYHWTDGERFVITGTTIPYTQPGKLGEIFGSWIVMQSEPAAQEPGFGLPDAAFDRRAHLGRYRRTYGAERSLYLPHTPWTPPIVNMEGPATDYPPGMEAELIRRASRTDKAEYLGHLAETITGGASSDADAVRRVAGYVNRALYYNPIQIPETRDPVAILEGHDARCGQGVTVTVAILEALGIPVRSVGLSHHVVAEATYDGSDHIVDALFFGANQPQKAGRVLSVAELKSNIYFADGFAQECFAYDPELLESEDRFWILGYVFGIWGSEPYYSYYLGAEKAHPPTFPLPLPAQRTGRQEVRLNWARSIKMGGGRIEYDVRVFSDRACREEVMTETTGNTSIVWEVPEANRMYFVEVRAVDDHRAGNPDTWYPAARTNFVLVPEDQYGWYGMM